MNFSKQEIRRFFLQRRKDLDKIYRQEAEKKIIAKLLQSWEFINSKNIAFYYSDGYEVDVKELFLATNMEKNFYLPRYIVDKKLYEMVKINDLDKDLQVGKYGLLEPKKELFAASKNELEQM